MSTEVKSSVLFRTEYMDWVYWIWYVHVLKHNIEAAVRGFEGRGYIFQATESGINYLKFQDL